MKNMFPLSQKVLVSFKQGDYITKLAKRNNISFWSMHKLTHTILIDGGLMILNVKGHRTKILVLTEHGKFTKELLSKVVK